METSLLELFRNCLADPACAVSVGGFGALAEFQDDAVQCREDADGSLVAYSERGACRLRPSADAVALAYETLAARHDNWQCGLSLLGPRASDAGGGRTTLTELGRDDDAVDPAARDGLLFDLGTGLPHMTFCVRTDDGALVDRLRAAAGQVVIATGHPVLEAIIDASPERVVTTCLARVEVYQPIDRHRTPEGPHTHLLPALVAKRRTHSANLPVGDDQVPLLTVHPEHPLTDRHGHRRPFRRAAFERFEHLLEAHGDPRYVAAKRTLRSAIERGLPPAQHVRAKQRVGRLAERIALRQLAHTCAPGTDLSPWFERLQP